MAKKNNFICQRCGECCKPLVYLSVDDIAAITELGYKDEVFITEDHFDTKKKVVRQINNRCYFLKEYPNGTKKCRIYASRPEICRKYPFLTNKELKDCKPHNFFEKAIREARELINKRGFI